MTGQPRKDPGREDYRMNLSKWMTVLAVVSVAFMLIVVAFVGGCSGTRGGNGGDGSGGDGGAQLILSDVGDLA